MTRTWPGLIRVSNGAWRGAMPSSPSSPVTTTMDASPEKISASALTISHWIVDAIGSITPDRAVSTPAQSEAGEIGLGRRAFLCGLLVEHFLALFHGLVDGADHVERLLRKMVVFAFDDALEAANRVLDRDIDTRRAGKYLGDEE